MKQQYLILPIIACALFLGACTQQASVPDNTQAKGEAQQSQGKASTAPNNDKGMEMRSENASKTMPPKPSIPSNLDKQSQDEIKEIDRSMELFDTDTYNAKDLEDMQ